MQTVIRVCGDPQGATDGDIEKSPFFPLRCCLGTLSLVDPLYREMDFLADVDDLQVIFKSKMCFDK